jgi:hypothetical protein
MIEFGVNILKHYVYGVLPKGGHKIVVSLTVTFNR